MTVDVSVVKDVERSVVTVVLLSVIVVVAEVDVVKLLEIVDDKAGGEAMLPGAAQAVAGSPSCEVKPLRLSR